VFRLAYNTNGLAHHRAVDALELLADLGYEGVSITPDVGELDLYRLDRALVAEVRACAEERGLALSLETGARFLLDPRRKHQPTLLDADPSKRARRIDMLRRTVDLARDLGAGLVSLWSGSVRDARGDELCADARTACDASMVEPVWTRLCEGLSIVLDHAHASAIAIAFEPEPGMFIERPAGYVELVRRLGARGDRLGLCLDVGHLLVTRDLPLDAILREHARSIVHVHLDDIRGGVHEHLMFGRGDLDLGLVLRTLVDVGYTGMAAVELSRDSHRGAQAAEEALVHVRRALSYTA
jgi:sugar phosphate isomerase/epimerase